MTDGLSSQGSAAKALGLSAWHRPGRLGANNRAENSYQPLRRRERLVQRFKSQGSAQQFVSTHAAIYNVFNVQRHLICRRTLRRFRDDATSTWRIATGAA